jgi:hypothetical protein
VPACKVSILTSKKHQSQVSQSFEDSFRTQWYVNISDQDPPTTDIVVAGMESTGALPVHDRWWISNGSGIRIGTSLNSLGIGSSSEISILTSDEAKAREREIDQYLNRERREYNKERIQYTLFTL